MMTPLILVRPQAFEPPQQPSLQLALRTLHELSRCSRSLRDLSACISLAVSQTTSQSSSSKEPG